MLLNSFVVDADPVPLDDALEEEVSVDEDNAAEEEEKGTGKWFCVGIEV